MSTTSEVPAEILDERRKLGAALKWLRLERGIPQHVVAREMGISRQAYRHYEAGRRSPKPEALPTLARLFGVSMAELAASWEAGGSRPGRVAECADGRAELADEVLTELRAIRRILGRVAEHLGAGDDPDR